MPTISTPRAVERRLDRIKVAAVQALVEQDTDPLPSTLQLLEKAGHEQCDLVVFPEYHLGHVAPDGSEIQTLQNACRRYKVNAVIGAWLDHSDGSSTNSALIFGRDGNLVGRYDKMHAAVGCDPHCWPPLGHEAEWHMKPGITFPTFDMDFGRLGVMTCYDGYFPEVPHCLSLAGAEVIAWINGRFGSIEDYLVRGYCFTSFVHIVAANQSTGAGTQIGHYPCHVLSISTEAKKDFFLTGHLDLATLREHRVNARMFHQRRPQLYGALVEKHEIWKNYPDMPQPPTIEQLEEQRASCTLVGAGN